MGKKILSFIVILLAYSLIGASIVIALSNVSGSAVNIGGDTFKYAYALDRAGNICFISDDSGEKSLVSVDSTGKKLFEKKTDEHIDADAYYVDSIYIEHDKNIYLAVCEYDENTQLVTDVSVHMFNEDGSYGDCILDRKVSGSINSSKSIFSAFSEDDDNIYFAINNNGTANVFKAPKNNSEHAAKIAGYRMNGEVYGMCALSDGSVAVGSDSGLTVYSSGGGRAVGNFVSPILDRFWNGISAFYAVDSSTGNIYSISNDYSVTIVVNGSKIINSERSLTTADMDDLAVGITGNIFGTVRGDSCSYFTGSFSVMSEIYINSGSETATLNFVLIIAAVCAGIILLTVLTWDFFVSILKMRLSILPRQSLLIALLIYAMMYSLCNFFLVPAVKNIVLENYTNQSRLIANSFEDSLVGLESDGESYDSYYDFLYGYGSAAADGDNASSLNAPEKPVVDLVENNAGVFRAVASSRLYPSGYPADRLLYGMSLSDTAAANDEYCGTDSSPFGDRMVLIRKINLPAAENDVYLVVSTTVDELSEAVSDIQNRIYLFLVIGGAALIVIFMVIENITAGAVRKLKRSVDRIARGEYDAAVDIKTGDEVEALSVSVKALSAHIIDKTTSLERLNNSYYRFVPQMFLSNLGETRIERVGKELHTHRQMSVMFVRFSFSQPLSGMEVQDIFDSINSVYEYILPIIDSNGGTAFNFRFNGLSVIFPESTENALLTAIKIREEINAFNEIQHKKNRRTAEVRIVIGEDNVLLGFIGDEKRMEPTVVSSVLNESEEIEKILSDSGLYIVCTESAFKRLPEEKYRSRRIGKFVTAEGGDMLYDMYDSDPYAMIKLKEQFLTRFSLGVGLFEKQDFANARNMFMDIVKYAPDDGVARNYMYISEYNLTAEKKLATYSVFGKIM